MVIINKSGIMIRMKVTDLRVMGRNTQGVRLINLEKKNDEIASVCKVQSQPELDEEISAEEVSDNSATDTPTQMFLTTIRIKKLIVLILFLNYEKKIMLLAVP